MSAHGDDQSWVARALCASTEPDALFVQGASQRQIRLRCYECEVRIECLADALQSEAKLRRVGWPDRTGASRDSAPLSACGGLAGVVAFLG